MKTTKEILVEARALIATPDRWTQHHQARNANGDLTSAMSAEAVCWCGWGAVWNVSFGADEDRIIAAEDALSKQTPSLHFPGWQDHVGRNHAEVLEVFDRAIAAQGDA